MFYEDNVPEFNVSNPTLPMLISEAAVDMDLCTRGTKNGGGVSIYLSKLLLDATIGESPLALRLPNMTVLSAAIPGRERIHSYWNGKTAQDIVLETRSLATSLSRFPKLPREEQIGLIDFCNRLYNESSLYRSELDNGRHRLVEA